MNFKKNLKQYQELVNRELEKYIETKKCPEEMLNCSMEYSLITSGKRLRPILVIATYEIFKKDIQECMPFAVAIEMVHNFSLIHDDLPGIDNDDFRHGKPSNHKQFNEATAILAGDRLLNNAYKIISENLENCKKEELAKKLRIFREFSEAVDKMILGEFVDTEVEGKQISKEDLEYIHKNKTGALLVLCVRMGAILAEASQEDLDRLTSYAEKIGLAFQVKDDILSEEGDEKILGKPVKNDEKQKKCTYVSKYGLSNAKEILEELIKEAIEDLQIYNTKAEFLVELAKFIKERNK